MIKKQKGFNRNKINHNNGKHIRFYNKGIA